MRHLIRNFLGGVAYAFLPVMAWVTSRFIANNKAYKAFLKRGLYLLRKHYSVPIPESEDCTETFWDSKSEMVGIAIDDAKIMKYVETELIRYNDEFKSYPITKETSKGGYYLLNGRFMAIDGNIYYNFIRRLKPKMILEIGCGFSTILASDAIEKNRSEGAPCKLICIDPYPPPEIKRESLNIEKILKKKVQLVEVEFFERIKANDILFIDSTHVLKSGGDVQYLYCEILPRLNTGVFVHIHDISLPRSYPKVYYDNYNFWNEQYLLQAFLTYNSHTEILWPGNYMALKQPERVLALFPEFNLMRNAYPYSEPTSFWFKTK